MVSFALTSLLATLSTNCSLHSHGVCLHWNDRMQPCNKVDCSKINTNHITKQYNQAIGYCQNHYKVYGNLKILDFNMIIGC